MLLKVHNDVAPNVTYQTSQGVPLSIRCLYTTPDGNLWIGYAGGWLGLMRNGQYARVTSEQGLFDDHISQIIADNQGLALARQRSRHLPGAATGDHGSGG